MYIQTIQIYKWGHCFSFFGELVDPVYNLNLDLEFQWKKMCISLCFSCKALILWLFLAQGLHLKSHHQRSSAGIRTWLSVDQSSSSTLTESIISSWTLSYTQRHCHVRIEKGPVQTIAIKLEAHNSLEYHYML